MKRHIERTQEHLGELGSLAEKTQRTEQRILEQAERRLEEVSAAIERARPGVEGAPEAAQKRYTDLVEERGQLHIVIARAKQALA